jgi:isoquinoline 1-oxidoreductase subunit beta
MSESMNDLASPTRRGFLAAGGATTALVIGFTLPETAHAKLGTNAANASASAFAPNAWLRITPDNKVTVICGSSEMGQGVHTAIPMMMAEELDADWNTVSVVQAPVDAAFANPAFQMQATGGSTTVRGHWDVVRKAGASARAVLVQAAAAKWGTTPDQCRTSAGKVIHTSGKSLSYGQLVADASKLKPPADVKLKDPADRKIMGQPKKRLDTPSKVNGSAKYGIDVALPGMLVAVMARAPLPGVKVAKVDDSKARAIKGVKNVLTIPTGVAVLADGYWAAKQGRDALKVEWDFGDRAGFSSAKATEVMSTAATAAKGAVGRNTGKPDDAKPAKVLEATYEAPFLAHACMEPMNCTAWVKGDSIEVWAGTQSQGPAQGILAQVGSVQPGNVKVNTMVLGGGFGRRFAPDVVIDATILSKMAGVPVKLIYTREDDMAAGFYRPPSVTKFKGGVEADGRLSMLTGTVATPSIMAASGFMKIPDNGVDTFAVEGIDDHPYNIADQRITFARTDLPPQVWFWRSVGHSQNSFFMEGFIDELAAAAGKDPFEFRRAALGKSPRHKQVLEVAAREAGWGKPLPAGVFRGIAVVSSFGSYVAEVAEVSINADGTPKVHRVVAAIDCGQIVNPAIIKRQVEGGIVFGLTAALYGKISFKDGKVEQGNFNDYAMLRMNEMPKVEVHIINSTEGPGGVGEPGTPPIAPAVANAIFAATGKRLRSLPFDTAQLKKA